MTKVVHFYFEFASPYSYLASIDIDERVERAGGRVEWSPIDLPRIWKAHGVLDAYLSIRTLKTPYIRQDAARCAKLAGIKLKPPRAQATDTSLAKRTYWGLIEAQDDRAKPFLKRISHTRCAVLFCAYSPTFNSTTGWIVTSVAT